MKTSSLTQTSTPMHDRRTFLRRAGLAGAVAAIAPAAAQVIMGNSTAMADDATDLDVAVLQFALNLEYVEAEFYSYAVHGDSITNHGAEITGQGASGQTILKPNFVKVPFSDFAIQSYAVEIAQDEINHVIFIRQALTQAGVTPVAKPELDLYNSFNTAATAAGIADTFDPFAGDVPFLLGGFIFEDVGVTAYKGAAPLITNKTYLGAAAGILAVEAYHSAILRTALFAANHAAGDNSIATTVKKISDLRDALDGSKDKDQGILDDSGFANIVPTNSLGIARARSTRKVLNIVYGAVDASKGLFFPNGFNGPIK